MKMKTVFIAVDLYPYFHLMRLQRKCKCRTTFPLKYTTVNIVVLSKISTSNLLIRCFKKSLLGVGHHHSWAARLHSRHVWLHLNSENKNI